MHVNQSLSRGDENAFLDESDELKLSTEAYSYIAGHPRPPAGDHGGRQPDGQLVQAAAAGLRGAGLHRLVAGQPVGRDPRAGQARPLDPDRAAHARSDREPVPGAGLHARGRAGRHQATAPAADPVNRNIYDLTEEESAELGITSLPHDLTHALDALEADPVMRDALGEHIFTEYVRLKRDEWAEYNEQVHRWELDQYMDRY